MSGAGAVPVRAADLDARGLALALIEALNQRDVPAALGLFAPGASFAIVPAALEGTAEREGRGFLESLVEAFPDLWIQVRGIMGTTEFATVEIVLEGTQAADFLGILNQEKHLDLAQAWMVWAKEGRIGGARAYWCQNQLYRRLAVKRLDRISILGDA
jgi:hypothetical protein